MGDRRRRKLLGLHHGLAQQLSRLRVLGAALPSEILVARTVRDLVVGSDIALSDRGTHSLKGIEGTWQLFAVVER